MEGAERAHGAGVRLRGRPGGRHRLRREATSGLEGPLTLMDPIDLALLVLRLAVGAVMLLHGWNHIFGGGKIAGTGRWFESLGMRPGWLHAWLASVTEVRGGAPLVRRMCMPI